MNNEERNKPDNEKPLDREEIHEENKREEDRARQHENQNPNLGKSVNPTHHNAGGR